MAYARKQFSFFVSYYDVAYDMDDDDRLAFYDAVLAYMFKDKDMERTLKRKGCKDAYRAFKSVKTHLISSKNKSKAGQEGNKKRWNKTPDGMGDSNESQTYRKAIAGASQLEEEIEEEFKEINKEKNRTAAACPKCGGVLDPTKAAENGLHVWWCPQCSREVLLDV